MDATDKKIEDILQKEYENGNVVFNTVEGPHTAPINDFLSQPIEGILYDLNRNEATILTFIDDPKWLNDYAVCKVIRQLHADRASLRQEVEELRKGLMFNGLVPNEKDLTIAKLEQEVERLKELVQNSAKVINIQRPLLDRMAEALKHYDTGVDEEIVSLLSEHKSTKE